jgi:hypothetical protein
MNYAEVNSAMFITGTALMGTVGLFSLIVFSVA